MITFDFEKFETKDPHPAFEQECPEIYKCLKVMLTNDKLTCSARGDDPWCLFFTYLASFVSEAVDKAPPVVSYIPQPSSYNPGQTGIALYFHKDGWRGRPMRQYGSQSSQPETEVPGCGKTFAG